jgi:hypothetical protein
MAMVKPSHYNAHDELQNHFDDFVVAYDFTRRLK